MSVAADLMGVLSNLEQFSAKKSRPSRASLLAISFVPHPLSTTAASRSEYAALAAIITIGPRAGSVATIFPRMPASSLAAIGIRPCSIVRRTCFRMSCFLISFRRIDIVIVSIIKPRYSFVWLASPFPSDFTISMIHPAFFRTS